MERREFVKISLTAAAVSAIPTSMYALNFEWLLQVIDLPPVMNHVRHGMFNLDIPETVAIPGFPTIKNIQRNRFLHNGYSIDAKQDPHLISIQMTDNQSVTLNIQQKVVKALGNSDLRSESVALANANSLTISDQLEGRLLQLAAGESITLQSVQNDMLIPVRGSYSLRGYLLSENQAILFSSGASVTIKGEADDTVALLLSNVE